MPNIFQRVRERARGKSLVDLHPEVESRQHLMSVRSDAQILAPYTYLDAIVTRESHVWVNKAVRLISDNSAALPLFVLRDKDRLDTHPALSLLSRPNAQMSQADLWNWWVADMLLGGEHGWEVVNNGRGKPVEIWPRQPHIFAVLPNPARRRYFEVAGYEIDDRQGDPYTLPPGEFVHYKYFNPRNPWRGIGVLLALRMAILIDVFAQAWERFLFQNNARPDYAVVTPQGTTRSEREDIEKKIEQKYGGVKNAGRVIALEEGITDIKILSYRPKDLGELELRKMSRDEIAGGFGVPDILMGFGSDTYDTEIKRTAAIQALYSMTIKPLLGFRDDKLTKAFQARGLLADNESLVTDYGGVAELQEEQDKAWTRAKEQIGCGALTINDWRAAAGLRPYPWGGLAWLPANLVPVSGAPTPPSEGQALQLRDVQAALSQDQIKASDLVSVIAFLAGALAQRSAPLEAPRGEHQEDA